MNNPQQISSFVFSEDFELLNYQSSFHNDCYKDLNDPLNSETLQQLVDFSEAIEEPYIFGKFNDNEHYLKMLNLVLASTNETRNRILFFLNEILPVLPIGGSLLDIGPGDGSLTRSLIHHFKYITAVDVNHHALNNLKKSLPHSVNFLQINTNILKAKLKKNSYDLAVLSHILYYVESKFWLDIVKSAYNSIKNNGILVIALSGDDLDKGELIKHFGGETLRINQLALECRNIFGFLNVTLYASNESFISYSQQTMLYISSFMLGDANITASKADLSKYISEKFKQFESYFEMTTRQKYIVIRKPEFKDKSYEIERLFAKNQSKN